MSIWAPPFNMLYITKLEELRQLVDFKQPIMFDLETGGLYGEIALAQFYQTDEAILWKSPNPLELVQLIAEAHLVGHNISYDLGTTFTQAAVTLGHRIAEPVIYNSDCTLLLSRIYYPKKQKFSLDFCLKYAGITGYTLDKKELQKSSWKGELTEAQLEYAAADVIYLDKLWNVVRDAKEENLYKLDKNFIKYCTKMQQNGMPVWEERVSSLTKELETKVAGFGLDFNVQSPKQVIDKLKTDKSDRITLSTLIAKDDERADLCRKILEERQIRKLLSNLTKYEKRFYGHFSPTAKSGRTRSSYENLQNIPSALKQCFKAPAGRVLIYSDFSQLELRCIAAITRDPKMCAMFNQGVDIHSQTAIDIFGSEEGEYRQLAKACNFGLLYGAGVSVFSNIILAATGKLRERAELASTIKRWKANYKSIARWQAKGFQDFADGVSWKTPLNREYLGGSGTEQLNIQVQGMGAEVAKAAFVLVNQKLNVRFVNFIHDSFILEVPDDEAYKSTCETVANSMQEAWRHVSSHLNGPVLPMPVSVVVGDNWGDLEAKRNIKYEIKR